LVSYTLLTILCYCLDGINFLIQYRFFGSNKVQGPVMILIIASLLYYVLDVMYLVWVVNIKDKLPPKLSKGVSDGMLGFTNTIKIQI